MSGVRPSLIGRKALTVNLSDIAAMAGVPRFAVVSLCLPADTTIEFLDGLYDGLLERAAEAGVCIVGGNLSSTPGPLAIDVTLLGQGDRLLRRDGAEAGRPGRGDRHPGRGRGRPGLPARRDAPGRGRDAQRRRDLDGRRSRTRSLACIRAQLDPTPPLAFARALAEHDIVHAAMDLSDGLSGRPPHLCQESDVSAWIDAASVPVDPCAAQLEKEGGDGRVLRSPCTAARTISSCSPCRPSAFDSLKDVAVVWDLPVTAVGELRRGPPGLSMKFGDTMRRLRPKSHEHFKDPGSRRPDPSAEA